METRLCESVLGNLHVEGGYFPLHHRGGSPLASVFVGSALADAVLSTRPNGAASAKADPAQSYFRRDNLLSRELDPVEMNWWELDRRAFRKTTARGQAVRVLLPLGEYLADGDILFDDGTTLVVVTVIPCEVLVVQPRDFAEMGRVALEIGNLHAPAQVNETELLIAPDGPVEAVLNRLGVIYQREQRQFHPLRCAGAPTWQFAADFEVRA